jgi:hypothetical protein
MLLTLLAFWHRLTIYLATVWDAAKQYMRVALGPAPQNFHLLSDGRVLPSSIPLPTSALATAYVYDPHTLRISQNNTPADARYRRLPYIAASYNNQNTGEVDISDWLGEIRASPVPDLHPKQLLMLWSLTHNRYVHLSDGAQATFTKSDGEIDHVVFE